MTAEKGLYGEHFYIDVFYNFEEDLVFGEPVTKISVRSELVFVKNSALIVKKIKEYYDQNVVSGFNKSFKPAIQRWIQDEIIQNEVFKKEQKSSRKEKQVRRERMEEDKEMKVEVRSDEEKQTPEEMSMNFIMALRE